MVLDGPGRGLLGGGVTGVVGVGPGWSGLSSTVLEQFQGTLEGQELDLIIILPQMLTCDEGPTPWTTCRAFPGANGLPNPLVGFSWRADVSWLEVVVVM